jgi:phosphoglycerate dehydrogenase-like enzyme
VLTPHAAFYSEEAYDELRSTVAENLVAFYETGRPLHSVNTPDLTATLSTSRGTHV